MSLYSAFRRLALIALATPTLLAQEPNRPDRPAGGANPPEGRPPRSMLIEALDLNRDRTVDAAELAKAAESLRKLDKNGDGRLTEDEFRPMRRNAPPSPPEPRGQPGRRPERPPSPAL